MNCRHCGMLLEETFLDLGFAPPSNAYLNQSDINKPEYYYPLIVKVCTHCWLVQTEDYAKKEELFDREYAYFSSTSKSWLDHSAQYVEMIGNRIGINQESFIIEIASNDGYLLKNFVSANVPCLGIEPTASTASAAERIGVPVLREFFGENLAKRLISEGKQADLIIANNVYAHVPDINDFTKGLKLALKPKGTITIEFPHFMRLIEQHQFDTVYHEHFSYLFLHVVNRMFKKVGLRVFDVDEVNTHGGSLRVYGCHIDDKRNTSSSVGKLLEEEIRCGLLDRATYSTFQSHANRIKNDLIQFLIKQKKAGKTVAAYGAAAKGNTLLNYAGIKPDLLAYVCDAAPSKQDKYLPGTHIPILSPEALNERKPDFVLILPWNLSDEITNQLKHIQKWGGTFVVAVPELREIS